MSTLPKFYRDTPYPERPWIGLAGVLFLAYYLITRFIIHAQDLPEPWETLFNLTWTSFFVIAGWHAITRKGYNKIFKFGLFIPFIGIFLSILFLVLPYKKDRKSKLKSIEEIS